MADYVDASSAVSQQEFLSDTYRFPTLDDSDAFYNNTYINVGQDHNLTSVRISGVELSHQIADHGCSACANKML